MAVKITHSCKCCHNQITQYINVNTSYEADAIQNAINDNDNYSWSIEDNIIALRVW